MPSFLDFLAPLNGLGVIFKLGIVPKDSELHELTSKQYEHFYATVADADEYLDEKLYMILPECSQKDVELASKQVFILTEKEIFIIKQAEKLIDDCCEQSRKKFNSFDEKLCYCASVMPYIVSEGTKYEKFAKIDSSKNQNKTETELMPRRKAKKKAGKKVQK